MLFKICGYFWVGWCIRVFTSAYKQAISALSNYFLQAHKPFVSKVCMFFECVQGNWICSKQYVSFCWWWIVFLHNKFLLLFSDQPLQINQGNIDEGKYQNMFKNTKPRKRLFVFFKSSYLNIKSLFLFRSCKS